MKVKVKMRSIFADAVQTASPGDVIDVEIHQARELLAGGYAEPANLAAKALIEGRTPAADRETATQRGLESRADAKEGEDAADGGKKKAPAKKKSSTIKPPSP